MSIITKPPIAETIRTEVLAASIASPTTITLSIEAKGSFQRPENNVAISRTVIVATIPATVLPASGPEEEEL